MTEQDDKMATDARKLATEIAPQRDLWPGIEAAIKELHSYELPEILAFDIKRGEEGFLHWILACSGKSKR